MDYMAKAITLAKLALGQVSPNPAVGAIIVKNREIVGRGFTQPPGGDHAEIVALKQSGELAQDATLYVTLEPCCHYGRTPPCTRAIIEAGIKEVHLATIDPNPLVNGKGAAELTNAGIKVISGEQLDNAKELIAAYHKHIIYGTPMVIAKFASSLDGKIATRSGESQWISSEESLKLAHSLRSFIDAIMVGANTVLRDNPHLTIRGSCGRGGLVRNQPLRIVIDGKGRTSPSALVFQEQGESLLVTARSLSAAEKQPFLKNNVEILELPADDGQVNLQELMLILGQRGITSVMVEGGGVLLGSLFDQGMVDRVFAFIAPLIIGGRDATQAIAGNGVEKLADAYRLKRIKIKQIDNDILISGYLKDI